MIGSFILAKTTQSEQEEDELSESGNALCKNEGMFGQGRRKLVFLWEPHKEGQRQ